MLDHGPFSPIPYLPPVGDPIWARRSEMVGIHLDLDEQLAFIERNLSGYIDQFSREVRDRGFELWNGLYQAGDAEVYYALVRHLKPRRIIEIGSGHSTLVSATANVTNAREGRPAELVAVDPEPRVPLDDVAGLAALERTDCRRLGLERYLELGANDILFFDTTHVVKLDSEVNWLLLEVLPRLREGVWVHFHDIHLPYEVPRYIIQLAGYLNEQYLLQGFLTGNREWKVELALAGLARERNGRLTELVPSLSEPVPNVPEVRTWLPAGFWIRKSAPAGWGASGAMRG